MIITEEAVAGKNSGEERGGPHHPPGAPFPRPNFCFSSTTCGGGTGRREVVT